MSFNSIEHSQLECHTQSFDIDEDSDKNLDL